MKKHSAVLLIAIAILLGFRFDLRVAQRLMFCVRFQIIRSADVARGLERVQLTLQPGDFAHTTGVWTNQAYSPICKKAA